MIRLITMCKQAIEPVCSSRGAGIKARASSRAQTLFCFLEEDFFFFLLLLFFLCLLDFFFFFFDFPFFFFLRLPLVAPACVKAGRKQNAAARQNQKRQKRCSIIISVGYASCVHTPAVARA